MYGPVRTLGVVRSVEDGYVVVQAAVERAKADFCHSKCKVCTHCEKEEDARIDLHVAVEAGERPEAGQEVMVEYERRDPALAAILFFLPPLAGLATGGYILAGILSGGDGMFLVGAFAGFVAGGLLSWGFSRSFPRLLRPEARIVEYR